MKDRAVKGQPSQGQPTKDEEQRIQGVLFIPCLQGGGLRRIWLFRDDLLKDSLQNMSSKGYKEYYISLVYKGVD